MRIVELRCTNFRNLSDTHVTFHEGIHLFLGPNGSGKTNLLEAIFTSCLGRSQRGATDTLLLGKQSDHYRLVANIERQGELCEVAVAYQSGGRKRISINSNPAKLSDLFRTFALVASGPEDTDTISGSPGSRRLFLDLYLSQLSANYLSDLSEYSRILAQKNAALKQGMETVAFDELLARSGSKIVQARREFLGQLSHMANRQYAELANGEQLSLSYDPQVSLEGGESLAEIESAFHIALQDAAIKERVTKIASVGPHRDDIAIQIGNLSARGCGSQGQWRTAVISMKLGVYQLLREKRGEPPILLLDELFAELDEDRTKALWNAFGSIDQLFLTTAHEPPALLKVKAHRYQVKNGQISSDARA